MLTMIPLQKEKPSCPLEIALVDEMHVILQQISVGHYKNSLAIRMYLITMIPLVLPPICVLGRQKLFLRSAGGRI